MVQQHWRRVDGRRPEKLGGHTKAAKAANVPVRLRAEYMYMYCVKQMYLYIHIYIRIYYICTNDMSAEFLTICREMEVTHYGHTFGPDYAG